MKTMAMPCSFSWRTIVKSCWTSSESRLDVGSSRIRTSAEMSMARAIATICCTAIEYLDSCAPTSSETSTRASASTARRLTARHWMRPRRRGSRPIEMFSATDRLGQRFTSW